MSSNGSNTMSLSDFRKQEIETSIRKEKRTGGIKLTTDNTLFITQTQHNMKKMMTMLALIFVCQLGFSQSVESLISDFKAAKGTTVMSFPKAMMQAALAETKDSEEAAIIKKVEQLTIVVTNECSKEVNEGLSAKVKALNDNTYEVISKEDKDGEFSIVLGKKDGENIKEVVVFAGEGGALVLTQVQGNFEPADIKGVMDIAK